jgi:ribonuclease HII
MKGKQALVSAETVLPPQPGELEEEGFSRGVERIAGMDEVGRGPLAGPVVAAGVIFPRGFAHSDITDSKLLTGKKRRELASCIKEHAVAWGVGVVGPDEIDRINILRASLLAMAYAFKQLHPAPDYLLIDGSHEIPFSSFADEGGQVQFVPQQKAIKKGDRLSVSIGAASIVAKVTRDEMMMEFDRIYPQYGFARHMGYGSSLHLAALRLHGPSPIHRRSFKPVRECLPDSLEAFPLSFL